MVIRMADKNRRAELVRNFSSEWLSWISCNYSETELQVTASSLDSIPDRWHCYLVASSVFLVKLAKLVGLL